MDDGLCLVYGAIPHMDIREQHTASMNISIKIFDLHC